MECVKIGLLVLLALFAGQTESATDTKVVCYYDSQAYNRPGNGKFDLNFLDPALQFCTHLIYGYAGIKEENFNIAPLDESLDINKQNYKHIVELKRRFPGLRVLLSVGGNRDVSGEGSEKNLKYRTLLESVETRLAFINSAHNLVKTYGFDGLDLAWEFPETKPRKIRNKISSWFVNLKHKIAGESITDEKAEEHKEQFIALVREFKNAFRHDGILLTLSQLPNVNGTVYYDPRQIAPNVDFVTVQAFDYRNPARNPKELDYPGPLYELPVVDEGRKFDENADYQIRYWLNQGLPANKLLLGIPTYGRAWKLNEDSGFTGVPPVAADGAADPGPYSNEAGLLSYPEICNKIANQKEIKAGYLGKLRKVNDPTKRYEEENRYWNVSDVTKRFGTYAYRLPDQNGENGIWVGFEDPDTVGNKAAYAKAKGLGGIAVLDITLDDFRGTCVSDNFPLLRAAKYRL
ncbi:chitinase-like protein Idgf4 isoform X1 [Dendroctonus ponderosae]|uniref:GH18 domain-containing protein n=1 Tax=Dendroctonus ponderosae TaxID=77166 RepID=A0AAR5Q1K6_DENPD|nr:chitinase-like protein Idgf4 isoform X1 [Dendroctonus ponderosae]